MGCVCVCVCVCIYIYFLLSVARFLGGVCQCAFCLTWDPTFALMFILWLYSYVGLHVCALLFCSSVSWPSVKSVLSVRMLVWEPLAIVTF
jgi:hypothetical protein